MPKVLRKEKVKMLNRKLHLGNELRTQSRAKMCQPLKCSSSANVFIMLPRSRGIRHARSSVTSPDTQPDALRSRAELATQIVDEKTRESSYYANSQLSFRNR